MVKWLLLYCKVNSLLITVTLCKTYSRNIQVLAYAPLPFWISPRKAVHVHVTGKNKHGNLTTLNILHNQPLDGCICEAMCQTLVEKKTSFDIGPEKKQTLL